MSERGHSGPLRAVGEEEDWSFVSNWASKPVTPAEVGDAVADLAELQGEHEIISDGSSADELIVAAETRTMMDSLSSVVTTLLNDPEVGRSVLDALAKDEGFRSMVEKYGGGPFVVPGSTISPAARPLLIASGEESVKAKAAANPLVNGLEALLESIAGAFCAFGNALRRLHEDLILVFRELRELGGAIDRGETGSQSAQSKGEWQAALMRLVTAVAVVVVARRVLLSKAA